MAVLYEADVQGFHIWAFGPLMQETLLAGTEPKAPGSATPLPLLSPYGSRGYAVGPPYTVAIPSGTLVRFWVALARLTSMLVPGPYASCLDTQVP